MIDLPLFIGLIILFFISFYWGLYHSKRKKEILKILTSFNRGQEQIYNLAELSKYIVHFFMNYTASQKGALFVYYRQGNELRLSGEIGVASVENFPPLITGSGVLSWAFSLTQPAVTVRELSSSLFTEAFPSFRERLKKEKFAYLIPLVEKNLLFGLIALGRGRKRLPFDLLEPLRIVAEHALESLYLYESSVIDETTNLYNKRFFRQALQAELRRSDRYHQPCSLLTFDLDDFKQINDLYGHPQGDRVLKELAERVCECIRKGIDIPARTGGEEFHIILPSTDSDRARLVAERIGSVIRERPFSGLKGMRRVTLSVGVATYPIHAEEESRLLALADQSLYLAKTQGKDKVCVAGELQNEQFPRLEPKPEIEKELFDPETLLYRSTYLAVRLKEELKRAVRYQFPCSFVLLGFETENESSFEAVKKFSTILRESLRIGIDTPAALDREHVGIIIPESDKEQARVMAQRLQSLAEGFTLSAGIVSFPEDAKNQENLMTKAFHALEVAQKQGIEQCVVWGEESRIENV